MKNKNNTILALRQLMKYSNNVKEYLRYTKNKYNLNWEKTLQEKPEIFKFTNKDFVKQNIDGCGYTHIIVTEKENYILTWDENTEDFYENHVLFENENTSVKRFLNNVNPIYIISFNFIDFETIKKKKYHWSPDYNEYKFECLKQKRIERCLELQLFNLIYYVCSNHVPDIISLKNENVYKSFIENKLKQILQAPIINKWCYPIQNVELTVADYEIDYTRHKFYVENVVNFEYQKDDGRICKVKWNSIFPSYIKFKLLIYPNHLSEILLATVYDNILQLVRAILPAFKDSNKALIISNLCSNGFSKPYLLKFKKLFE